MSLPISWVVAGAIPATQALKQTVQLAGTSASHFFGELLQTNPPPASLQPARQSAAGNGRSEENAPNLTPRLNSGDGKDDGKGVSGKGLDGRIETLRRSLAKFLDESRSRFGLKAGSGDGVAGDGESLSITANGREPLRLKGPEPLRTELENHLRDHPEIVQEINALALQKSNAGPLRLMPSSDKRAAASEPWTLWLDP